MGSTLSVAMSDPNIAALDELKFRTGFNIEAMLATDTQIRQSTERFYNNKAVEETKKPEVENSGIQEMMKDLEEASDAATMEVVETSDELDVDALQKESGEAPVIRLVNMILVEALKQRASDIHIEPYEREFRVRYRVDGVLQTIMSPPLTFREALTSRVKIMASLNISEKRVPQDGRIKLRMKLRDKSKELDFRVSCLPTLFGEKIVLRLLDKENLMFDLRKLGFETESLRRFDSAINKPFGLVLVTGPTGSGKTNTLYSAISQLNKVDTNIMTAEDPVEFNLPGVNQVNIKDQVGLNFAAALRSFLRQDPNIILVGEIRDLETAEIAIKASMTGHLVFSTLHTNDAAATVSRLINMGIEPFLLGTSVNVVCAQRLVRRICKDCKRPAEPPSMQVLLDVGFEPEEAKTLKLMKGAGCPTCKGGGFKGRVGLYEVMAMTDGLREAILSGSNTVQLKRAAVQDGMITLRRSGITKIMEGITTIEEVVRETVK
jgi:type IV pilus assembly protein PilB